MRARCWVVFGSIALMACGSSAEVSDRSSGGEVPEALALVLTNAPEEGRIFVGTPPAPLSAILRDVTELTVVGGLTREGGGTLVFEVNGSVEAALDSYADRIEHDGWERAPNDRGFRGGFLPSPQPVSGTWCTGTHWLRASSASFAGIEYLRVWYREADLEPTPCENAQMRAQMSFGYGFQMPTLNPPPGAEVELSGGGGSTNDASIEASLVTELSAEEVFSHYVRQVEMDGWEGGVITSGEGLAIGTWSAQDDDGKPAQGLLAIWPLPQSDAYRALLRMERVRSER